MENKVKICIISPYIYSLFNIKCRGRFGGAEVQLYLLSKEFVKYKNVLVNIITGDYDFKKLKIKSYNNIKIYISQPLDKKIKNYLERPLKLFFTLIKSNPDVIIQRIGGIETGICALYCKLFNKKFIFSIAHKNDVSKLGKKGIKQLFYNYGLQGSDFIVAQDKTQIADLIKWKGDHIKNVHVIKPGYDILNSNDKMKNYILWIGRAVKWKRPELFLKLAKKFPHLSFIMVCVKGKNLEDWNSLYIKSKENKNLEFVEFIPFHKINNYFKSAKIFINTSISEGFPNTFIQALKNKTPIVSLNVDPDDFLMTFKCGFNCKDDFNMMFSYVEMLLNNKELYRNYSRNDYNHVKKFHDIQKNGFQWIRLVKYILSKN